MCFDSEAVTKYVSSGKHTFRKIMQLVCFYIYILLNKVLKALRLVSRDGKSFNNHKALASWDEGIGEILLQETSVRT